MLLMVGMLLVLSGNLWAQGTDPADIAAVVTGLDTVWILIAAFLMFFMQAGFGMVEAGFIRAKNATNILTKNFLDFCMASLGFFAFGYAVMFGAVPVHGLNGVLGTLAIGIFGKQGLGLANDSLVYGGGFAQLGIQALGAAAVAFFILVSMGIVFKLIDITVCLRVSREEEYRGLDIGEHGMASYSGFQIID